MFIKSQSSRNSTRRRAILVEPLESRTLLTTIVVKTTSDAPNLPANQMGLRAAITAADDATSPTIITFDPTVFSPHKTIVLGGSQLELTNTKESIIIKGPAAGLTIDGTPNGLLQVDKKVTATISDVTLTGAGKNFQAGDDGLLNYGKVTLTNVHADGNEGAGIDNKGTILFDSGSASHDENGSGISNDSSGIMTLVDVTLDGDENGSAGGDIDNYGKMTLTDVDILNGDSAEGGGIFNDGSMTLTNVTMSGSTTESVSELTNGGGIENWGTMTVMDSTIVGNVVADGSGGGVSNDGGTLYMGNSIVWDNQAFESDDVLGKIKSLGHNLIGNASGSSGWKSSDIIGVNPKLGALANNGGLTQTMLPQAGSPAINAGSNSLIPHGITTDQRGLPRISGSSVDIGAVEVQLPTVFSGTVFNDANKSGKKDSGEAGLAGWEVYDDANNNGKLDSGETLSFTTSTGSYGLGILGTGTAHIREIVPSNWSQTTPSNNGAISITLSPGSSHSNENFGDHTSVKYLSTVATTSGIVGWWTFDSTSQANSILNGYTGSLKGGATISTSAGAPINGESKNTGLSLNGTSAYVNTDLINQQPFTTAATVNAWIDLGPTPAKSGHFYDIATKSVFANDLDLQVETDGSVHFYTDSGTSTSFKPTSLTGWHMLTAEFDTAAKIRKIFWDGKLVASSTPGSHSASSGTFAIGESGVFAGRFFDGKIDEVSLWNRALTSSEVSGIFNASQA